MLLTCPLFFFTNTILLFFNKQRDDAASSWTTTAPKRKQECQPRSLKARGHDGRRQPFVSRRLDCRLEAQKQKLVGLLVTSAWGRVLVGDLAEFLADGSSNESWWRRCGDKSS